MRTYVIFFMLLINGVVFSQTYLEKSMKSADVTYIPSEKFIISQNKEQVYPVEISEKNPLPSLAENYGVVLARPETYINSLFAMVHAIFQSKKDDYIVLVRSGYGGDEKFGVVVRNEEFSEEEKFYLELIGFDGVKRDLRYGRFFQGSDEKEAYEMLQMLKIFPKEEARKMFNAQILFSYPIDLHGNAYNEKYKRAKCFVLQGKRSIIFLYFLMTNDNYWKADTFLKDFEGVFRFND